MRCAASSGVIPADSLAHRSTSGRTGARGPLIGHIVGRRFGSRTCDTRASKLRSLLLGAGSRCFCPRLRVPLAEAAAAGRDNRKRRITPVRLAEPHRFPGRLVLDACQQPTDRAVAPMTEQLDLRLLDPAANGCRRQLLVRLAREHISRDAVTVVVGMLPPDRREASCACGTRNLGCIREPVLSPRGQPRTERVWPSVDLLPRLDPVRPGVRASSSLHGTIVTERGRIVCDVADRPFREASSLSVERRAACHILVRGRFKLQADCKRAALMAVLSRADAAHA